MTSLFSKSIATTAPRATVLIRLLVGLVVFVPEGIQKLIYADLLGAGRFLKIGIPFPDFFGPFVGITELICGLLVVFGLFTRLATIPLLITMAVALVSTKLPILLGSEVGPFHLQKLARYGFWSMQHEARTDLAMVFACAYLLVVGAGAWSLDAWLTAKRRRE